MNVRFSTFPKTRTPPLFVKSVVDVFEKHWDRIGTTHLAKGLKSDEVLAVLYSDLTALSFRVEAGKKRADKILRPVFYGENAEPDLQYEIDAWHEEWRAGLEIEAGRAWLGNAIYRDLVQALVMVEMEHLIVGVPQEYHYNTGGRPTVSKDYENARSVAQALYGHSRIVMPFSLCVIGY